jgi:hypothetical protein
MIKDRTATVVDLLIVLVVLAAIDLIHLVVLAKLILKGCGR